MLNQGMTGIEIAEQIELPPALERAWHARGYYGSVSHNVKAVYQRYMGWFDGNPAHLWQHPPVEESRRYLDCMGGASKVLALARDYTAQGDLRFAATLLNHVVFADPDNADAKTSLAEVYQRLGEGAECGTWRNFYLTGAMELRQGVTATPFAFSEGMTAGLTTEQLFDSLAIRVNGPKAWNEHLTIDWSFTDTGDRYRTTLTHGALTHRKAAGNGTGANLTVTLTRPQLLGMLTGKGTQDVTTEGDTSALHRLMGVLDNPDPAFPIVTP